MATIIEYKDALELVDGGGGYLRLVDTTSKLLLVSGNVTWDENSPAGTLGSSGSLSRSAGKQTAGTLGLAGALGPMNIFKNVAGTLTPTGALSAIRNIARLASVGIITSIQTAAQTILQPTNEDE